MANVPSLFFTRLFCNIQNLSIHFFVKCDAILRVAFLKNRLRYAGAWPQFEKVSHKNKIKNTLNFPNEHWKLRIDLLCIHQSTCIEALTFEQGHLPLSASDNYK